MTDERKHCPTCGSTNPASSRACIVCETPLERPPSPFESTTAAPYEPVRELVELRAPDQPGLMGALAGSWELLRSDWLKFWLLWVLYFAVSAGVGMIPFVGAIAPLIIGGPLTLGLWRAVLEAYDGRQVDPGRLFSGFERFVHGLLIYLASIVPVVVLVGISLVAFIPKLISIATSGAELESFPEEELLGLLPFVPIPILAALAGGVLYSGLQTTYGIVADDDGISVGDALQRGWQLTKDNLGSFLLMSLGTAGIAFACILFICVGWVLLLAWVAPVLQLWPMLYYRDLLTRVRRG